MSPVAGIPLRSRLLFVVVATVVAGLAIGEGSAAAGERALAPYRESPPSSQRLLELMHTITGDISPKSVVHSGTGLFFAQNMMYRHSITVYDRSFDLVTTIPDAVDLSAFGQAHEPGPYRGAPVEAAFTSDGAYAFVSNYQMYGPGFARSGGDGCGQADWDESYVYRIDVARLAVDAVLRAGAVPKFVVVSPDDRYVLVSNWCSFDLSVFEAGTLGEVARIDLGRHPRGIAVDPTSQFAYVAVMGSTDVARVRLADSSVEWIRGVGRGPRHVVMDSSGDYLYVTLNGEDRVAKLDAETGEVLAKVASGSAPRSMAIAPDGESLYVVNYYSDTLSKIRTADMAVVQQVPTAHHPIGVTYDAATDQVWVSAYSGAIEVFADRPWCARCPL